MSDQPTRASGQGKSARQSPSDDRSVDPEEPICVLHLTDTHLNRRARTASPPVSLADAVAALSGRTTDEALEHVLTKSRERPVDLILHTGDLIDDETAEAYRHAFEQLERLDLPVLICAGNHDVPTLLAQETRKRGWPGRHVDVGVWRILTLNTNGGAHGGHLAGSELEALHNLGSEWDGPVLLGLHHPPVSTCDHPDCVLANASELLDVIDGLGNVAAVASGHLHAASEAERSGVKYLLGPSTCLQLRHVHPLPEHNREGTQGGAQWINLFPSGEVRSSIFWA